MIQELLQLRATILRFEDDSIAALADLSGAKRDSARNLLHYLALRRCDIRQLQEQLASLGLSSLGRAEAHVLGTLRAVLAVLHPLAERSLPVDLQDDTALGVGAGNALLDRHTQLLLGPNPSQRSVRIMVTMPPEAAGDRWLVRELLAHGMDVMRINCAHDDAAAWARMIDHLRRAERELGRSCRILMDLGGPKLRTGAVLPGPAVMRWSPRRDAYGRVLAAARIWLTPAHASETCPQSDASVLPVDGAWLEALGDGDVVDFLDARGAHRRLRITGSVGRSRWAESSQSAFVAEGTMLQARTALAAGVGESVCRVGAVASQAQCLLLRPGDTLMLTRGPAPGAPAEYDAAGRLLHPAHIPCTLPEVFAAVRPGEAILFDDGKLAGVIRRVEPHALHIEITHADSRGVKLRPDKGINLPDTQFQLPALTNEDLTDLQFIAAHADLVGLSYVQCPADVSELQTRLKALRAEHLGIVLKIETRQAFEQLPQLLLAAMRSPAAGVMIARGDLAVECGWERLAEIQEEILWLCEAAHMPVIWATQVLETLAKTGVPSRAEITDAAMGVRAECVMLNKGPHIIEAIRVLDAILQRMQAHQTKKTSRLRRLLSWESYETTRSVVPWQAGSADASAAPGAQRGPRALPSPDIEPVVSLSGTNSSLPSNS